MKKIIVLVLAFAMILSISACSIKSEKLEEQSKDEEVIEEYVSEGKLVFNEKDLDSILKHVTKVVLIDSASYKETVMEKDFPIPETIYNIEKLKVINKNDKDINDLIKGLEQNKKSLKVIVDGGIVTKAQWYENLRDEFKDKSAGREYVEKPVGKEAKKKMKIYAHEYVELESDKIYLILSSGVKTNNFYADAYTVFEYNKKSDTFYNPVSGLRFTLKELVSKLK